jgi:transcriptional regulator with XRE-family HTH domain
VTQEPDGAGQLLRAWRLRCGQSQTDTAAALGVTQQYLSQLETGRGAVPLELRRRVVRELGVPAEELGLASDAQRPGAPPARDPEVVASQLAWRQERRWMNRNRSDLAQLAAGLYPSDWHVPRSGLIAEPRWRLDQPLDLDDLSLHLDEKPRQLLIDGTEPQSEPARPLRTETERFRAYTAAVQQLDRPSLFESRPSYRLVDVTLGSRRLSFGLANYFDKLDISEAVGHELAALTLPLKSIPARVGRTPGPVPFRDLIGDPFNLSRRAVIPAISTLTIRLRRYPAEPSFILHWRDPRKVATAAGVYDVIPAGEFQPSSVNPWDRHSDFDLWRNIVREYSEEFLGTPEHDGTRSQPIDYDGWPFYQQLQEARRKGMLQVFLLGMGLDALTLAATILTVVVIDDDEFRSVFGNATALNEEGEIMNPDGGPPLDGVPFTGAAVHRLLSTEPMASPGAACVSLAWQHRRDLLGL